MALNPPSTTVPELYNGQTVADMSEKSGVSQLEYNNELKANPNLNPDVVIGNILTRRSADQLKVAPEKKPAPSVITSGMADKKDTENLYNLNKATSPTNQQISTQQKPADESGLSALDAQSQNEYNNYISQIDAYQAKSDVATQGLLQGIKDSFARQRQAVNDLNKGVLGAQTQAGIRAGRNIYAPEMESLRLGEEQKRGIARLGEVDAAEKEALAQAQSAADSKDFELLDKRMSAFNNLQQQKRQQIIDLHNMTIENEKLAMDKAKEERDAIAELNKPIIEANAQAQKVAFGWMNEYPDAGIDPFSDSPETATQKVLSSKIFQSKQQEKFTGAVGEYQFYAQQEKQSGREPVSFNEYQNMDANRKALIQNGLTQGLTPAQSSIVSKIAGSFDSEPVVKEYSKIAEASDFAKNLNVNTKNPADDQALIYAFAKAMDPASAVKEGEYATIQRYAQSWADSFGFKAKKIFSNTTFLTPQARQNMKDTIESKAKASEKNYNSLYSEYGRRIELQSGATDGKSFLTDYSKPYGGGETSSSGFSQDDYDYILQSRGKAAADIYKSDPQSFSSVGGDTNKATAVNTVKLPSGQTREGGSASWRNNNPLNIKFGKFAQGYGANNGSAAQDGGVFAAFPTEEAGLKAARDLLRASSYTNLSLDQAMKRWSGGGYGADVAPTALRNKKTGQMTDSELTQLINSMRQREGWREGKIYA